MSVDIQPIVRTRGDTHPIRVTLIDGDGAALDLTGCSLVLTVSSQEDPPESLAPQVALLGSIVAPEADGIVEFEMTELEADFVGLYYYDIQITDASGYIRTALRGTFEMRQDITKTQESLWTADGGTAVDGSDGIYFIKTHANDAFEYSVRDGVPILRCNFNYSDSSLYRYLVPDLGALDFTLPWRFTCLCYMDDTWYSQATLPIGINSYRYFYWENEPGYRDVSVGCRWPDTITQINRYDSSSSAQLSTTAGWVRVAFEWEPTTDKMSGKMWMDGDAEPDWQTVTQDGEEAIVIPGTERTAFVLGLATFSNPANVEIAWMKLEVLP